MSDGGVLACVGAVEQAVKQGQRAGAVAGADGVGEFVKGALFGAEDHGFDVAEGDASASEGVEEEFFEFGGDEHHVCAEGVDEFSCGVGIEACLLLLGGGDDPAHGVGIFDAGQLDDGAEVAEGFAQAFVAILVVHLHAAEIGWNGEVVCEEQDECLGVGRAEVAVDFGELFLFGAAGVELLEIAHEDDLKRGHERRGSRAVEGIEDGSVCEVDLGEAEIAHVRGYEGIEDGAATAFVEEDVVTGEDVAWLERAGCWNAVGCGRFGGGNLGNEAIGSGKADSLALSGQEGNPGRSLLMAPTTLSKKFIVYRIVVGGAGWSVEMWIAGPGRIRMSTGCAL